MSSNTLVEILDAKDHDRFWSKVDKSAGPDACWPWIARVGERGYGQFRNKGHMVLSHRIACASKHGPLGTLQALHSCDNPPCCNPDHTFPGTQTTNVQDCISKGRHATGSKNGFATLTEDSVLEIRRLRGKGMTYRDIAKVINCHFSTVGYVITGKIRRSA